MMLLHFVFFLVLFFRRSADDGKEKELGSFRQRALRHGLCIRSNTWPEIGAFLGDGTSDGRTFQFALVVHDHAGVVFEVDEGTILSAEWLALPDDHGGQDFLAQIWFALLDRRWKKKRKEHA